ncbi:hypothetical protein J3A83DRAFT_4193249 [Scleroderma citrinum]
MVNAPPQKKAWMGGGIEHSPTQGVTLPSGHPTLFPDFDPAGTYTTMDDVPAQSFKLPRSQFLYKEVFSSVLHDMETPPDLMCCIAAHELNPFHRIERWSGTFFEDFTWRLAGFIMHLDHGGKPCPQGGYSSQNISTSDEDKWEDLDSGDEPPHLARPNDRSFITVGSQLQLLRAGLFLTIIKDYRTEFTFNVLDDFLQDHVECGTMAMNYYSKLCRVTSNAFPHLIPGTTKAVPCVETPEAVKMKAFHFCPACPQLRINIPGAHNIDLSKWKYLQVIVTDGNFKAEHMTPKNTGNEFWLMDGHRYMVGSWRYKTYLTGTKATVAVGQIQSPWLLTDLVKRSDCSNHCVVNQANTGRGHLASTGIDALSLIQWSIFKKGSSKSTWTTC